jgi:SAM-dependent methyltransferase
MPSALYDQIGGTYVSTRRPDPRVAAVIGHALGDARTVINVGAGAGAYEPAQLSVIAVEPSRHMIRQRTAGTFPAIQGMAEALPFRDAAFDAALALLTLQHWADWRRGVDEMKRVANRLVVFTFEPGGRNFWLTATYFPEIIELDRRRCPSVADLVRYCGDCGVEPVPVPHDCTDGFLAAYWRRPEAYLDSRVRAGMSGFALLDANVVTRGVAHLRSDLESGAWEQRFGHLRQVEALDAGYRILITDGNPSRPARPPGNGATAQSAR